jgi:antitoxin CcdA
MGFRRFNGRVAKAIYRLRLAASGWCTYGMRMKAAHTARTRSPRRPTNVSLDSALVEEARRLGINLSQAFEAHLHELVRTRRAAAWAEENTQAFYAYNQFVTRAGIWNEDERDW